MKDGRGFWTGDYWGVIAFGANLSFVNSVPKDWNDLLTANYKVALNDDPRKANAAFSGVFAAALANGGSLNDITPGIDFFAKLAKAGKFQAVNVTPQTVASGQTPVTLDWDYNQLGYKKTYTQLQVGRRRPEKRSLRRLLLPGDQRDRPASVRSAAVGGVPLLRPGAAAVPRGLRAPGTVPGSRRQEGDPEATARRATAGVDLRGGQVREPRADRQGQGSRGRPVGPEGPRGLGT